MASTVHSARFTVPVADSQSPHGIWWPHTRSLADELTHLVRAWPADRGRITRILYSPPDWDDRPHSVLVNGRRMKTGSFPRDDTHQMTLVLHDGRRRSISVIPPGTSRSDANGLLEGFGDGESERPGWENEGGYV